MDSRRYVQSADRVAIDGEGVTQVDGCTWKVAFQMHAGNVLSFPGRLHAEQWLGSLSISSQLRHCPACPGNPFFVRPNWVARTKRAMTTRRATVLDSPPPLVFFTLP